MFGCCAGGRWCWWRWYVRLFFFFFSHFYIGRKLFVSVHVQSFRSVGSSFIWTLSSLFEQQQQHNATNNEKWEKRGGRERERARMKSVSWFGTERSQAWGRQASEEWKMRIRRGLEEWVSARGMSHWLNTQEYCVSIFFFCKLRGFFLSRMFLGNSVRLLRSSVRIVPFSLRSNDSGCIAPSEILILLLRRVYVHLYCSSASNV